jgi:S-adenosylmethionine/arginine decarboxylase-like enzyme
VKGVYKLSQSGPQVGYVNSYWGFHLLLDCAELDPVAINSYETIYNFVKQLVLDIDMVPYGEPHIVNFGSGNKAGYTLVQLIETSNITAHFVPDDGQGGNAMYLDVFSCKEYNDQVVVNLVKEYFGAKYIRPNYLTRQA